jgi:hypothetical protein
MTTAATAAVRSTNAGLRFNLRPEFIAKRRSLTRRADPGTDSPQDITGQLRRPRNNDLEAAFVPYGQKSFKIWLIEGRRRDGAANV